MDRSDYHQALRGPIELTNFEFGELAKSLRGKLMWAATISVLAVIFLTPDRGGEIQLAVTWFPLKVPAMALYAMLFITCVYLLTHFIVECRHRVRPQFADMASAFAREVVEREGDIKFSELKSGVFPKLAATIQFKSTEGTRLSASSVLFLPTLYLLVMQPCIPLGPAVVPHFI
jgi:hypothetical protein